MGNCISISTGWYKADEHNEEYLIVFRQISCICETITIININIMIEEFLLLHCSSRQ